MSNRTDSDMPWLDDVGSLFNAGEESPRPRKSAIEINIHSQ